MVVWLGASVTARWEASYPFLRTDHQTKEKSAWGHNRLSSPTHMTALSSVSASQQGSAILNNTTGEYTIELQSHMESL